MKLISSRIHTYVGLLVGLVLVVAPFILGFSDESAPTWTAIGVGLFILLNEPLTTSPSSLLKIVPMRVHLVLDVVAGIFLAASPWLFGFSDLDPIAWVPHLVVGILVAGYAIVTDPSDSVVPAGTAGNNGAGNTARRP